MAALHLLVDNSTARTRPKRIRDFLTAHLRIHCTSLALPGRWTRLPERLWLVRPFQFQTW